MNLFILGATGGIGQHLLPLALERGHRVTAYVRNPAKIALTHGSLRVLQGDLFDPAALSPAMAGHDLVLSAFGPTSLRASTQRGDFGTALAASLRQSGVFRLQLVSAAFLFSGLGLLPRLLKATLFRQIVPDMAAMEEAVHQPDLGWTILRPPRLTNRPATAAYRIADGQLPPGGFTISRTDVAAFMIGEAETPRHLRRIVGLAD